MNLDFWRGRSVLVTGHTGFKGAWLSFLLNELGTKVSGLALAPSTQPNLHDLLSLGEQTDGVFADINDAAALGQLMAQSRPQVVLHLAAQALVRASYADPVGTIAANVTGVATVLDCVRRAPSVEAVIVVTSDKCYDNREWVWGYRENDRLGGRDPYSASKGCAEIVAAAMRSSFFGVPGGHPARIATVRAGNVIGGGDWSADRLVPDIIRGALGDDGTVRLRNPGAVRPWQHVLEPIAAYLDLARRMVEGEPVDEAWNFGPDAGADRSVMEVAEALVGRLGKGQIVVEAQQDAPHEANVLRLDCAKAKARLGWSARLDFAAGLDLTAQWYADWAAGRDPAGLTRSQIQLFLKAA